MANPPSSNRGDDFDPQKAIERLSANLEQPDKFAELFCLAAKKQKEIDNVLKENIRDIIKNDNEARAQIKGLLREIEFEDLKFFLKKGGNILIVFISALGGAILTLLTNHFSK